MATSQVWRKVEKLLIPFEMSKLVEYSLYGHFFGLTVSLCVEGPRCVCLSLGRQRILSASTPNDKTVAFTEWTEGRRGAHARTRAHTPRGPLKTVKSSA